MHTFLSGYYSYFRVKKHSFLEREHIKRETERYRKKTKRKKVNKKNKHIPEMPYILPDTVTTQKKIKKEKEKKNLK